MFFKLVIAASLLVSFSFANAESETLKGAKADFDKVKKELNAKMSDLDQELGELKLKAKQNGKATQQKAIDEMEVAKTKLQKQIDDLKDDSKGEWKKLKNKIADSMDAFAAKVRKALKEE